MAGEFIGSKSLPVKSPAGRAQAGRKSRGEQDGKRREQKIALERWEENGTGRKQQNQIGGFTPYSDQRCHMRTSCSPWLLVKGTRPSHRKARMDQSKSSNRSNRLAALLCARRP